MPDKISSLYNTVSKDYDLGTFEEFRTKMNDPSKRKTFFDQISGDYDLGSFESFEINLGVKKKEPSSASSTGLVGGLGLPSQQPDQHKSLTDLGFNILPTTSQPAGPIQGAKPTYGDIENVIANAAAAQKKLTETQRKDKFVGDKFDIAADAQYRDLNKQIEAEDRANLAVAMSNKDKVLKENQYAVNKPIDKLISTGEYKQFFTEDGVFDQAKAQKYFNSWTDKYGGGTFLRETWMSSLKQRGQQELDKPLYNELFNNELKKRGVDPSKYSDKFFSNLYAPQISNLENIKNTAQAESSSVLNASKSKAVEKTNSFNIYVSLLNQKIKSGEVTPEQAADQYEKARAQYSKDLNAIDVEFKTSVSKINESVKQRSARIQQEIKSLSSSVGDDAVWNSMPKDVREKIQASQSAAYANLQGIKNAKKKGSDILASSFLTPGAGLMSKTIRSSFNKGLSMLGDYMVSRGIDNGFSQWLRSNITDAEKNAPAQYEWNKDEWMNKLITSTGSSIGVSLPIMLPTVAISAASEGTAIPTIASGLISFLGETAQISGDAYRTKLESTGDVIEAQKYADRIAEENKKNIGLYFIGGLGEQFLVKAKGAKKIIGGLGLEMAEEIPVEYSQSYSEAKINGYNKGIGQFIKENPEIGAETFLTTLGMSGTFAGLGRAWTTLRGSSSAPQTLADVVDKKGVDFAKALLDSYKKQGLINDEQYNQQVSIIDKVGLSLSKLSDLGITGDMAKLHTMLSLESEDIENSLKSETDESVKAINQKKLNNIKSDISGLADNKTPYIVFNNPGGSDATVVMTERQFNELSPEKADNVIKAADGVSVFGNEELSRSLQERKLSLGNMDIEGAYTNPQNITNATTQSIQPEGLPEGGVTESEAIGEGQPEVGQGEGQQGQTTQPQANVGDSNLGGERQIAPAGKRLFNNPNPEASLIEAEYKKQKGIKTAEPAKITSIDESRSKSMADAYEQVPDSSNDPETQKGYQEMADQTVDQYKAISDKGVKVELWTGDGEPYKNSDEMIKDVRDNKHMYIFSTEQGFGETPITEEQRSQNALLRDSGFKDVNGKPLLVNDIFRFVHDYFGHTKLGNSFGPVGEENAWNVHVRMYNTPLARRAMTMETRGQNSWVNFNKSMRNEDGSIKKKGDKGFVPASQRPFAEQKMGLFPEEFSQVEDSYSAKSISENTKQDVDKIKKADIQSIDGATLNLDGTTYTGGGLVVPIDTIETTQENLTPEMIENFVNDNKGKIGDGKFTVGLFKFGGSNKVSIDISVVVDPKNQKKALAFAKMAGQNSIYNLDTKETIETGESGDNVVKFSDADYKEISRALTNGEVPKVSAIDKTLSSAADMVEKSLKASGVKVNIIDSSVNPEDAKKLRGNQGLFVSKTGEIFIDKATLANDIEAGIVVWHEGAHPVMNIIRNTNKTLYDTLVRGIDKAAQSNKGIMSAMQWAQKEYSKEKLSERLGREVTDQEAKQVQNDEALVEIVGRINSGLININSLNPGFKQNIINFVNAIAKMLGLKQFKGTDMAQFKKTVGDVADALRTGRDISEIVGAENILEYGSEIGSPTQLRTGDITGEDVSFDGSYDLSFVKPDDKINITDLVKEIYSKGQKVWFWTADQLGRGMYYDKIIKGEHYLDAGPSFALDPENRDKGVIWATGKSESWINDKIANSDYIFIISGSPTKSKLFNRRVAEITFNRIKQSVESENAWDKFKSEILSVSKIGQINNIVNKYNSFEELLESPDRKPLLIKFDEQQTVKGTPLKSLLEKYNAFIDYNELRDGFYKENDFQLNDIMLVLKPTGYGGKSSHSTYENNLLGEVVGVPDKKINAFDIMPTEFKEKYKPEIPRTEQSQAVAPYGVGIRNVQASVGGRPEFTPEFKIAAMAMRMKSEGMSDADIKSQLSSIKGLSKEDIDSAVSGPDQFIRDKFGDMSKLQQDNLIEIAKRQNVYRGRQFGKPNEFTGFEIPMDVVQEYLDRNKSRDRNFKDIANDFKNKMLDPARGLPNFVLALKDFATGSKNVEIAKAIETIKALKEEARKIGFKDWDLFSKAMADVPKVERVIPDETGLELFNPERAADGKPFTTPDENLPAVIPDSLKKLPESIAPFAVKMRSQIDALTRDLIGNGYVSPDQAATLEANIGKYVNRAYKMYNEKRWKPGKELIDSAVRFIANQKYKDLLQQYYDANKPESVEKETSDLSKFEGNVGGVADIPHAQLMQQALEEAQKDVQAILDKKRNPYFGTRDESRDTGILKERKDIPEPIRKLMGEYVDPGTVFIMTVAKQAALKAQSEYLTGLREKGMGTMFFEKNDPKRPASHSVEIAGDTTESKSPLGGLFTTPEIAEALNTVNPTYNELTNLWMKLVGAVRWGKTVGSVATQLKNFESNLGFAVMNGLLLTGKGTEAFKEAGKYMSGRITNKEISGITEKVIKLNLVGQSVGSREISDMLGSGDIHDIALDVATNPKSKFRKNAKTINVVSELNKIYGLSDDFWKVYAYINEREMVAKGRYNKSYSELTKEEEEAVDLESSERVKSTWPTYDRVFEAAKYISKRLPITGNFISFQAESLRVLANTIALAAKDIKDPQMRSSGMKRMAGIIAYSSLRTAITLAIASAAGVAASGILGAVLGDDEEEKKKRAFKKALPMYARTGDLMIKKGDQPWKYTVINVSSLDPYGAIPNSLNAITDGREGIFSKEMQPGIGAAAAEFFSPFLEPEMTFDAMEAIRYNIDPKTGKPIVLDGDDAGEVLAKVSAFLWKNMEPSTVSLVNRGLERGWAPEAAASFGARPMDVDLHKSFGFIMSEASKQIEAVSNEYNKIKYGDKPEDEKKEAQLRAEKKKAFIISRLNETYKDFISIGADPKVLDEIIITRPAIKVTGFDVNTKRGIKTGIFNSEYLYK